ncbi:hypothetical protein BsWGS_01891 [Bradybaena similaris]
MNTVTFKCEIKEMYASTAESRSVFYNIMEKFVLSPTHPWKGIRTCCDQVKVEVTLEIEGLLNTCKFHYMIFFQRSVQVLRHNSSITVSMLFTDQSCAPLHHDSSAP